MKVFLFTRAAIHRLNALLHVYFLFILRAIDKLVDMIVMMALFKRQLFLIKEIEQMRLNIML